MAALFLVTNDIYYFQESENIDIFKKIFKKDNEEEIFKKIKKIISFPTSDEEIKKYLLDETVCFLGANLPKLALDYCVIKYLPNSLGIKTKQQEEYKENVSTVLFEKFGVTVSYPTIKYDQLGGFDEPKREIPKAMELIEEGVIDKVLTLLLGVSRGGKSYLAEVIAGEYNRMLIMLDLGIMMSFENPSKALDDFCRYIEKIDGYVLLIDEMEKVVSGSTDSATQKIMMGKLLTLLNNLNGESGYNFGSNPIIATANRIDDLLKTNPEFINRFNFKYFVNFPKEEAFINISNIYLKKANIQGITAEQIYAITNTKFVEFGQDTELNYAKYAPGEVKLLVQQLLLESKKGNNGKRIASREILDKCLNSIQPQIKYAKKGVGMTLAAAIQAGFKEVS